MSNVRRDMIEEISEKITNSTYWSQDPSTGVYDDWDQVDEQVSDIIEENNPGSLSDEYASQIPTDQLFYILSDLDTEVLDEILTIINNSLGGDEDYFEEGIDPRSKSINDKYFPVVDIDDDNYDYYKYNGRDLAYDYKNALLIILFKNQEEIDEYGYKSAPFRELCSVGFSRENWKDKPTRKEYLDDYLFEIDQETNDLANDFINNEYSSLQEDNEIDEEDEYYTPYGNYKYVVAPWEFEFRDIRTNSEEEAVKEWFKKSNKYKGGVVAILARDEDAARSLINYCYDDLSIINDLNSKYPTQYKIEYLTDQIENAYNKSTKLIDWEYDQVSPFSYG